jgi:glycosyltransferase involved in cell wall biosynthesis
MSRALKLLFVLPVYEPAWSFGGVVRCMSNLCRGLVALGHAVTVYTIHTEGQAHRPSGASGEAVDQGGVLTYFFPPTFSSSPAFDSRALITHLRQTIHNFDLVYVGALWQWLGIAVAATCARENVPFVMGIHGGFLKALRHKNGAKKMIYWFLFLKRALTRASALHLTTHYELKESCDLLGNYKCFIVPNSLDCSYFRPMKQHRAGFRQRFGIPLSAPLLLTVGRADATKRFDLLIQALSAVSELNLLIVGPEPCNLMDKWNTLAKELNVSDRIFWSGHLVGEELLQAYSAADIFSLISNSENFAMVVVEAMACGLPILINPEVGVSEFLQNTDGIVIVEKKSPAIAQALQGLLNHRKNWDSWSDRNLRSAQNLFGRESVAALMAQAFENLLSSSRN